MSHDSMVLFSFFCRPYILSYDGTKLMRFMYCIFMGAPINGYIISIVNHISEQAKNLLNTCLSIY